MMSTNAPDITPIAEHPEVRAIQDKVNALRGDIESDTRRIEDLSRPDSETAAAVAERIREAATVLLEGGDVSEHAVVDRDSALSELYRRRRLRREALKLAEGRLRDVRARVNAEIVEAQRPAYRAFIEAMAPIVFQLTQLAGRERAFRAELEAAGVSPVGLEPVVLPGFDIEDEGSRASRWLAEAAERHGVRIPELEKLRKRQREHAEQIARQEAAEMQAKRDEEEADKQAELRRRRKAHDEMVAKRERYLLTLASQPREGAR